MNNSSRCFEFTQITTFVRRLLFSRVIFGASILAGWIAFVAPSVAADIGAAGISPSTQSSLDAIEPRKGAEVQNTEARLNSLLFFGGRMSTTDIYSTMALNLNRSTGQHYDNYIVGIAYNRDLLYLGYGFYLGGEIGIADRFGQYKQCCGPVIRSSSILQSPEVWGGAQLRYTGITLFNTVKVGFGITFGLSAATSSIGQEAQWSSENSSTGHVLYYLGPELDIAFPSMPNVELVFKLHHRSGGKTVPFLPTIAGRGEGYNGNVVGIRYHF